MNSDNLSEYWHDVAPILKKQAKEKREKLFDERLNYAIKQFEENNIPFKLCDKNNGHFNLLKNGKVVMSYWSYTGKCYIPCIKYSNNIGIKSCINKYKKI